MSYDKNLFIRVFNEAIQGRSERKVAEGSGVSYSSIGNWRKGIRPTDSGSIRSVADYVGRPRIPLLVAAEYLPEKGDVDSDLANHPSVYEDVKYRALMDAVLTMAKATDQTKE